jgi:type 1 glutamine amidotransferase
MAVSKKATKGGKSKPAKRKAALIVQGGWQGHTPKECSERFAAWLEEKGFRVVVSDTLDIYTNKRRMRHFNLIVPLWTMGEISGPQWNGLRDAILGGAHVAGFHGGMCDSFRQNTEYQFMTGGQWVVHPGGIIRHKYNITNQKDPITKGLKDFRMKSEQYYMHTDPGNEVLATTTFSGRQGGTPWIKGTVMPAVWKRKYGTSRIFYTSLGHVNDDFEVPEAFEIVKRGMMWAAGEKIVPEYQS